MSRAEDELYDKLDVALQALVEISELDFGGRAISIATEALDEIREVSEGYSRNGCSGGNSD